MSITNEPEPTPVPSISTLRAEASEKPHRDPNLVEFDGSDDPSDPLNWPFKEKILVTMLYSFLTMGATWASTWQVSPHTDQLAVS
jgi:hypothetical protein